MFFNNQFIAAGWALVLSVQVTSGAALTACPTTETKVTGASGAKYVSCPETDFQDTGVQILNNTADLASCVQQVRNPSFVQTPSS